MGLRPLGQANNFALSLMIEGVALALRLIQAVILIQTVASFTNSTNVCGRLRGLGVGGVRLAARVVALLAANVIVIGRGDGLIVASVVLDR